MAVSCSSQSAMGSPGEVTNILQRTVLPESFGYCDLCFGIPLCLKIPVCVHEILSTIIKQALCEMILPNCGLL